MRRRIAIAATLALGCMISPVPHARAAYDPVGSGTTKITLDRSFLAALKQEGVELSAVAPAKLAGGTVSFPVAGGKFDPTSGSGTVAHEGGLTFRAGSRVLPLTVLQLKTTQRRSPFTVKAGGSQLKLATAGRLAVVRQGFGGSVNVMQLELSAKLATRLGKKLRLKRAFSEGQALGSARTTIKPGTVTVLGKNKVSLALAPDFAAKLSALFVAVNPVFPAEHPGDFTLPIFGGDLAPNGAAGRVETSGSLEFLQLGGGQVFWADNWLDPVAGAASPEVEVLPAPPYAGKLGRQVVSSFALSGPPVANAKDRTIAVSEANLSLSPFTAQTFNEVFAKPQGKDNVFAAGEPLGRVSFTAQGQ
ncbi:MAG: hypothetical protein ACJ75T_07350 [Solirubrobacterales bacterium]